MIHVLRFFRLRVLCSAMAAGLAMSGCGGGGSGADSGGGGAGTGGGGGTIGGVPADTSVANDNNELAAWIRSARNSNPKLRICIKADGDATYPQIQKVVKTLEGWKIFKFNLITGLKTVPPGTAAYEIQNAGMKKH